MEFYFNSYIHGFRTWSEVNRIKIIIYNWIPAKRKLWSFITSINVLTVKAHDPRLIVLKYIYVHDSSIWTTTESLIFSRSACKTFIYSD